MPGGRKRRSEIWNHFSQIDPSKIKCNYCSYMISAERKSTGNLTRHLRVRHPYIAIDKSTKPQLTSFSPVPENSTDVPSTSNEDPLEIERSNSPTTTQSILSNKSKALDQQLVRMIIKEYQPFKIVEDVEFRKFVDLLCPGYNLPSQTVISDRLIPELFNRTLESVKSNINEACAVCITTDSWTSASLTNESFLTITAHSINKDNQLHSNLLECVEFSQEQTVENLIAALKCVFQQWKITNKIAAVVTDNTVNMTSAIERCGWRHFPCFAHSLNSLVQTGLNDIKVTIEKIREVVEFFTVNSQALSKLYTAQEEVGDGQIKLKLDVPTRWNSTYEMLTQILKTKATLISTLTVLSETNPLTAHDWAIAELASSILTVFNYVTIEISSEKFVPISKVILFVKSMKNHIAKHLRAAAPLPQEIIQMLHTLQDELVHRFKNVEDNELILLPTLLDPRFKKFGFNSPTQYEKAIGILRGKICGDLTTLAGSKETNSSLWGEFDNDSSEAMGKLNGDEAPAIIELNKYLEEQVIKRQDDPLKWWQDRSYIYPSLYKLMQENLCIVASSVPCERIFSKTGQLLIEKRNRLSPSKMPQILFLNHNL